MCFRKWDCLEQKRNVLRNLSTSFYINAYIRAMKVNLAESILDKVDFNGIDDWEIYPEAQYTCGCGESVFFNLRNLSKHSRSDFTNLRQEDVLEIENIINDTVRTETNSFLDFYCPGCKRPVRFYYLSWAGGRHGEYGYRIKYVVDTTKNWKAILNLLKIIIRKFFRSS